MKGVSLVSRAQGCEGDGRTKWNWETIVNVDEKRTDLGKGGRSEQLRELLKTKNHVFNLSPDRIFMFCSGHHNLHECGPSSNKLDLIRFGPLPSE